MTVLAGNKHRSAWLVGLLAQAGWLLWIVISGNVGFLPMNIALWIVYGRNHWKWNTVSKARASKGMSASVEPCGGLKMRKSAREAIRIAESEGIERPRIEQGTPHGRLFGILAGQPFVMVISLTKCSQNRGPAYLRDNIRKAKRRIAEGIRP